MDTEKEKYVRLRNLAKGYARFRGLNCQSAEDFSQDYCLQVFEEKTGNLKWQFANFVRKQIGEDSQKNKENDLWDDHHADQDHIDPDRRLEILNMRKFIKIIRDKKIRLVMELILCDVPRSVIAEVFDVSAWSIGNFYNQGLRELRKKFIPI